MYNDIRKESPMNILTALSLPKAQEARFLTISPELKKRLQAIALLKVNRLRRERRLRMVAARIIPKW